MNFALLGCDATLFPLLRAIAADAEHTLKTAALIPDRLTAELLAAAPGVRLESVGEGLSHDPAIDAVIASAGGAEIDECVKRLADAGKPVLFAPNGDPTSSLVYELALVRDDTHVSLVPLFPLRAVNSLRCVAEMLRSGAWGEPLLIQWTRSLSIADCAAASSGRRVEASGLAGGRSVPGVSDSASPPHVEKTTTTNAPPLITAKSVQRALVHDADMLRQLGGNYSQVTAVRSGETDQGFAMLAVTLAGAGLPTATWTARPATDGAAFELQITTKTGTVTLSSPSRAGETSSAACEIAGNLPGIDQIRAAPETPPLTAHQPHVAAAVLRQFIEAVAGAKTSPDWTDLIRATEIVEAAERSMRRRRTIDLHFETTSERNQFKTQMTAVGCGLMSMTLVSLIFLLMAGALFNVHPLVMKIARIGIFVPLFLFLVLQLLLFISRPAKPETNESPDRSAGDDRNRSGGRPI